MPENDEVTAAATGAAAAVAAVQDDQAEADRVSSMETATAVATDAAELAAERAEVAAEAASAATEQASQATEQAAAASATAAAASDEAYSARDHVEQLRHEFSEGLQGLRAHLDSKFDPPAQTSQPTEVVVSDERSNPAPDSGSDSGSGGTPSAERVSRHRFGHRR